jgi:hypothetical protein
VSRRHDDDGGVDGVSPVQQEQHLGSSSKSSTMSATPTTAAAEAQAGTTTFNPLVTDSPGFFGWASVGNQAGTAVCEYLLSFALTYSPFPASIDLLCDVVLREPVDL